MISIREVKESELEAVALLEGQVFSDSWTLQGLKETYAQPGAFILAAYSEGQMLGYSIVYTVLDEAELVRIAVAASARRQGVGQMILKNTEQVSAKRGAARMFLEVRMNNEPAAAFYRKHGFRVDGIRKAFYQKPIDDAVLMSKKLDADAN